MLWRLVKNSDELRRGLIARIRFPKRRPDGFGGADVVPRPHPDKSDQRRRDSADRRNPDRPAWTERVGDKSHDRGPERCSTDDDGGVDRHDPTTKLVVG